LTFYFEKDDRVGIELFVLPVEGSELFGYGASWTVFSSLLLLVVPSPILAQSLGFSSKLDHM
jgi:hypothetical protein